MLCTLESKTASEWYRKNTEALRGLTMGEAAKREPEFALTLAMWAAEGRCRTKEIERHGKWWCKHWRVQEMMSAEQKRKVKKAEKKWMKSGGRWDESEDECEEESEEEWSEDGEMSEASESRDGNMLSDSELTAQHAIDESLNDCEDNAYEESEEDENECESSEEVEDNESIERKRWEESEEETVSEAASFAAGDEALYTQRDGQQIRVTVVRVSTNVPPGEEPDISVRMPGGTVRETVLARLAPVASEDGEESEDIIVDGTDGEDEDEEYVQELSSESESGEENESKARIFRVGDKVEAKQGIGINDGYYNAIIKKVHRGGMEYTLEWEDGDERATRQPHGNIVDRKTI